MRVKIVAVLLFVFVMQCGYGIPFATDFSPESLRRMEKFDKVIRQLWQDYTSKEGDPPSVIGSTFGDGTTTITGRNMNSYTGRPINAFMGFKYASAKRFELPELEDDFVTGSEFNATHFGPICPQLPYEGPFGLQDEECLYLNVYSPDISEGTSLPVMVFIHGGGFIIGASDTYLPTKLLEHDVILVTINYRLGTLGWFFMDNDEAPGNYALYDQAMALEWVQKHISDFGGDKNKVTVFGQSAGSVSVAYMQITPQAKGKMRGIISESGSVLDTWAYDYDPWYATNFIANQTGCLIGQDVDLACLKDDVHYTELVEATLTLVTSDRKSGLTGFRGVTPTAQGEMVTNPILVDPPLQYFVRRDLNDVPQLMGATKTEGSYISGLMYNTYLVPNGLENDTEYFEEMVYPDILSSIGVFDVSNALAESLKLYFCPAEDVNMSIFDEVIYCVIDTMGALYLKGGAWQVANYLSLFGTKDVYYYTFDYESEDSMFRALVGDVPFEGGVTHTDDIIYIFPFGFEMNGTQIDVMNRMTYLWTNFATYLDPTPDDMQEETEALGLPEYIPYKFEDTHYMLMREEFTMEEDFRLRWTIGIDEIRAGKQVTTEPPVTDEPINLQDEYDKVAEEADMYLAVMISFILAFCISLIVAAFFWGKANKTA